MLAVLLVVTSAWAGPSIPVNRDPNGLNWSPDGTATGDHKFVTLYPDVQDGVNGLWCSDCACDTNGICIQGTAGVDGAFAYRRNGQWECQCSAASCLDCSSLAGCCAVDGTACAQASECCNAGCFNGVCQACIPPLQVCVNSRDCCSSNCLAGFCTSGCQSSGAFCESNGDCCAGLLCLDNNTCGVASTTTTSTSTSTTSSTAGVSTTTSTSTSSTSTSSTTLALTSPVGIFPPIPGTILSQDTVAPHLFCGVLRATAGVTVTHLQTAFQSTGFCTAAVYDDNDTGALLGSVTAACPNPGVVTGSVSFTLGAGAQYRFCVCSTSPTGKYLGFYNVSLTSLADAFSVSIGQSATSCNASTGVAPSTTGALSAATLPLPWMTVE